MARHVAPSGVPEPPAVEVLEATKREIEERVAGWTNGALLLHQRLNRNEQALSIPGDMPYVLAILQYEEAAIAAELRRRSSALISPGRAKRSRSTPDERSTET